MPGDAGALRGVRVALVDAGGEAAALWALLDDVDLRGCVLTLDALHACRDTVRAIVRTHGADYVLSVKENCPDSFAKLAAIDWEADGLRRHAEQPKKAHGRIEARRVAARDLLPDTLAPFPEVRQAFCVVRERTVATKTGATSTETAYGITTVPPNAPARSGCWPGTAATGRWRTATTTAATPAWARTPPASAPATPPPTTPRSPTSCSRWCSTTASATSPRPTATT